MRWVFVKAVLWAVILSLAGSKAGAEQYSCPADCPTIPVKTLMFGSNSEIKAAYKQIQNAGEACQKQCLQKLIEDLQTVRIPAAISEHAHADKTMEDALEKAFRNNSIPSGKVEWLQFIIQNKLFDQENQTQTKRACIDKWCINIKDTKGMPNTNQQTRLASCIEDPMCRYIVNKAGVILCFCPLHLRQMKITTEMSQKEKCLLITEIMQTSALVMLIKECFCRTEQK